MVPLYLFYQYYCWLPKLVQQKATWNNSPTIADLSSNLASIFFLIIIGIIFVQEGTRRIPIVSARQLGKGQSQNKTSYLPLRLNQGGVMPIIFASAVLVLTSLSTTGYSNETE